MVVSALAAYGVRRAVTSPGSRNAPLLMALERSEEIQAIPVIDERCAAFEALGMADISGEPVALCCTSGTALLNYAPAIAEAYYREIPLIVVSADRPEAWIDQADSQTIRQPGALGNIVKATVDLGDSQDSDEYLWYCNRMLNDALSAATSGPKGPVHINVHLTAPLTTETEIDPAEAVFHKIDIIAPAEVIPTETARRLALNLIGRQVLVVGGFHSPDDKLGKALAAISTIEGFRVIDEGLANIRGAIIETGPDTPIGMPEVLITFGGSLVSAKLKEALRQCGSIKEHWHVGLEGRAVDTFRKLTTRIDFPAAGFFPRLAGALGHHVRTGELKPKLIAANQATPSDNSAEWDSATAVATLLSKVPRQWNIQLGNGMSVRRALPLVAGGRFHRVSSNRGVSGIDGCVSTAIGASAAYGKPTLLIVGDMSAQYDMGALASGQVTPKMKIAVLDNGGGEIFRRVATTRALPERERLIAGGVKLPLRQLAESFGFSYLEAADRESLSEAAKQMAAESQRPCMLRIIIDNEQLKQP